MRSRAALPRALWVLFFAASLAGCSSLPFFGDKDKDAAEAEPLITQYELEVDAPKPLDKLLLDYLDLGRFQKTPRADAITSSELDRLAAAAPAQARALLETEGYFNATVTIARSDPPGSLPRLTITVEPGPQGRWFRSVDLDTATPLAPKEATRDEPWSDRLEHLRKIWPLPPGKPFREADWSSAKTATIGALRADGYPKATWQSTRARIDATDNLADLALVAEGGPLYHLGPISVEGVSVFDDVAVLRLATFSRGDVYSERTLLDYQDRLMKLGLFEGASVELDATGPPEDAPVRVKVKELTQYQANFGIGYSANTGPRASVELYDRKVFGAPWVAHVPLVYGPENKLAGIELTSYPLENQWRNQLAANIEELLTAGETRDSVTARVGRSKDTIRYERVYYAELVKARVESAPLTSVSSAVTANYHWLHRDVDNVLQPTDGVALSLQGGRRLGRRAPAAIRPAGRADEQGAVRAHLRARDVVPTVRQLVRQRPARGRPGVRAQPDRRSRHDPVPGRWRQLGARLRLPHARADRQRRRRRRTRPGDRQRRVRASAHRPAAAADGRRLRRRRQCGRRLARLASGVRLRRRPALPQPGRAAEPRRRLRPARSPVPRLPERRRHVHCAMTDDPASADPAEPRARRGDAATPPAPTRLALARRHRARR